MSNKVLKDQKLQQDRSAGFTVTSNYEAAVKAKAAFVKQLSKPKAPAIVKIRLRPDGEFHVIAYTAVAQPVAE